MLATVQENNKVKESNIKEKKKNYHPDQYSRCGAVGCDTAMFVMIQTSIHGEITKQGPQIDDDSSTCVALAQHIIANIVMAILSAD